METQESRFWRQVRKADGDACWEWQGPLDRYGYGNIRYNGRTIGAHRASWEIAHGRRADRKLVICHGCDNPRCVRASHLTLGTKAQNTREAFERGLIPPQGNRWKR